MTVSELAKNLSLEILSGDEDALARPVTGGYCGDLLSWVMGRAPSGGVWITIMSNVNVAAVAQLSDVSCVILAEGVSPDAALRNRAEMEGLPLLSSPDPAFSLAGRIFPMIS